MKDSQRPTALKEQDFSGDCTVYTHPAFGVLRVTNPQGGNVELFGSDIPHNSRVRMEICSATWKRSLHNDWIYGENTPIVAFEMSHAQFVSSIQSSGSYTGTPITLRVVPKSRKDLEAVPFIESLESPIDMIKNEIAEDTRKRLQAAEKALDDLEQALNNKSGIKVIREKMATAKRLVSQTPSNVQFALDCAQEEIEKKKHNAKVEIDALVENKVRSIGLEAIVKQGNLEDLLLGHNGNAGE